MVAVGDIDDKPTASAASLAVLVCILALGYVSAKSVSSEFMHHNCCSHFLSCHYMLHCRCVTSLYTKVDTLQRQLHADRYMNGQAVDTTSGSPVCSAADPQKAGGFLLIPTAP